MREINKKEAIFLFTGNHLRSHFCSFSIASIPSLCGYFAIFA